MIVDGFAMVYSATEVRVADRIYRTWLDRTMADAEHVMLTVLALIDLSPEQAESVRTLESVDN